MSKILNPRVETLEGQTVCLCGEPGCAEVLATVVDAGEGAGVTVVLPSLITQVGEWKGVKRFARDMAQEFNPLDPNGHLKFSAAELPIVVICPASHQENLVTADVFL